REWNLSSRTKLIEFAERHQIPIAKDKRGEAPFSIDANLLHTSSEGKRRFAARSEEHTSELQSLTNLVCRLLLEKKNTLTVEAAAGPASDAARRATAASNASATIVGRDEELRVVHTPFADMHAFGPQRDRGSGLH